MTRADLTLRLRRHWGWKTFGITAGMSIFFAVYFHLLHRPAYPVTILTPSPLDAWITFQPLALIPYLSLWVYVSLGPGLLLTLRELRAYAAAATTLAIAGLAVFYFWPTAIPATVLPEPAPAALLFLKKVDAAGNALPSLHAAFAVFTAGNLHRLLHSTRTPALILALNWTWALAIVYSTLATKQHVAVDALAGSLLGAGATVTYARVTRVNRSCAAAGNTHA